MWRVVDIGGAQYFLHAADNSLVIEKGDETKAKIPFADIHSIVCHSLGCRYSDEFFKQSMAHDIPVTFCDEKHVPVGMLLPVNQHTDFWDRQQVQIEALWQRSCAIRDWSCNGLEIRRGWQHCECWLNGFVLEILTTKKHKVPGYIFRPYLAKILSDVTTISLISG